MLSELNKFIRDDRVKAIKKLEQQLKELDRRIEEAGKKITQDAWDAMSDKEQDAEEKKTMDLYIERDVINRDISDFEDEIGHIDYIDTL